MSLTIRCTLVSCLEYTLGWGLNSLQRWILWPQPTGFFKSCFLLLEILFIKSRWQHGFPWFSLSLSLSLSICSYHPLFPAGLPFYILCLHRAAVNKFLQVDQELAWPYVGVLRRTSLMSLSLFLQKCQTCFVCLIWMLFEMGGKWLIAVCFIGYCFQDLFKIDHSKLVSFSSSFFSFVSMTIY